MSIPPVLSDAERRTIEEKRREALSRRNRLGDSTNFGINKRPHFFTQSSLSSDGDVTKRAALSTVRKQYALPSHKDDKFVSQAPGLDAIPSKIQAAQTKSKFVHIPAKVTTKAKCILISRDRFEVKCDYHAGLIVVFKALPTRVFDHSSRNWNFLLSDYKDFLHRASAVDEVVLEGLSSAVVSAFKSQIEGGSVPAPMSANIKLLEERLPHSIVDSLMNFQKEGVSLALQRGGRILLADDMGLGKTLQGLSIAAAYRYEWPLLIVAPSSVRFSWREQIIRWLGAPLHLSRADIDVVSSTRAFTPDDYLYQGEKKCKIVIFSYDLLARCSKQLSSLPPFRVVIMDESHCLKNFKTARCKAAMPILKNSKRAILLTGTPALSRPMELFPQISSVQPTLFKGGFHEFGLRYCAAVENPWGWDYSGCSNMNELQLILEETIMIRRVKSEVLCQLPPKNREFVILDPSLIKIGRLKRPDLNLPNFDLQALEKHGELLRCFMETGRAKIPAVEQYVSDLLESDRKFILFAHHSEMLDAVGRLLESKAIQFIRIDGKTPADQRCVVCDRFQNDEQCKVALLSITAAGTGISLTSATLVVFAELFWNPGVLVQAEDRAYRIGQQDCVNVQYLIGEGTVDDHLWSLVKSKLEVLTMAGLNQESFDNIALTRIPPSKDKNQTLDDFFQVDFTLPDDMLAEFDKPLPIPASEITAPTNTLSSKLVADEQISRRLSPVFPAFGPLTSHSQSSESISSQKTVLQGVGKERLILVPASPEYDADDKTSPSEGGSLNPQPPPRSSSIAENFFKQADDTDSILQSAALEAEAAWLTEAFLTEGLNDSIFS